MGFLFLFDFEPQPREDLVYSVRETPFKEKTMQMFQNLEYSVFNEFATVIELQNWTMMTSCT